MESWRILMSWDCLSAAQSQDTWSAWKHLLRDLNMLWRCLLPQITAGRAEACEVVYLRQEKNVEESSSEEEEERRHLVLLKSWTI
jgi:hypothetical protein